MLINSFLCCFRDKLSHFNSNKMLHGYGSSGIQTKKLFSWEEFYGNNGEAITNFTGVITSQIKSGDKNIYVYEGVFENFQTNGIVINAQTSLLIEASTFSKFRSSAQGGIINFKGNGIVFSRVCAFEVENFNSYTLGCISSKETNILYDSTLFNIYNQMYNFNIVFLIGNPLIKNLNLTDTFNRQQCGITAFSPVDLKFSYSSFIQTKEDAIIYLNSKSATVYIDKTNFINNTHNTAGVGLIFSLGKDMIISNTFFKYNVCKYIVALKEAGAKGSLINCSIDFGSEALSPALSMSNNTNAVIVNRIIHLETRECQPYFLPPRTPFETPFKSPFNSPFQSPLLTPLETPLITPLETPYETPFKTPFVTPFNSPYATVKTAPSVKPIIPDRSPMKTPHETWNGKWEENNEERVVPEYDVPQIRETHRPLQTEYVKTPVPKVKAITNISLGVVIIIIIAVLTGINIFTTARKLKNIIEGHGDFSGSLELEVEELVGESYSYDYSGYAYSTNEYEEEEEYNNSYLYSEYSSYTTE